MLSAPAAREILAKVTGWAGRTGGPGHGAEICL